MNILAQHASPLDKFSRHWIWSRTIEVTGGRSVKMHVHDRLASLDVLLSPTQNSRAYLALLLDCSQLSAFGTKFGVERSVLNPSIRRGAKIANASARDRKTVQACPRITGKARETEIKNEIEKIVL